MGWGVPIQRGGWATVKAAASTPDTPKFPCGSWLACDSARSANITGACAAAIAGKPAPTFRLSAWVLGKRTGPEVPQGGTTFDCPHAYIALSCRCVANKNGTTRL
ncbi:hypothetical protein B4O85_07795 [Pseudomonas azotoformans]|uniref:Uncharacterized protein n=1 Tax=Pseudomonas azotoformans TaxID=47878 RepID=A0A4Q0HVK4_PSEAZ|nr:hypothetical protein B4O85_07795 [Pseudomonas azotoformans]